ncbi:hypothetical protein pb186bvf_018636 [Paramecium bursaria]
MLLILLFRVQAEINCTLGQYNNSQECVNCPAICFACISDINCTLCSSGYFLNGTNCIQCGPQCQICNGINTCQQCKDGFSLYNGNCLDANSIQLMDGQISIMYNNTNASLSFYIQLKNQLFQSQLSQNLLGFPISQASYFSLGFQKSSQHDLDLILISYTQQYNVDDAQLDSMTYTIVKDTDMNQLDNLIVSILPSTNITQINVTKPAVGSPSDIKLDLSQSTMQVLWAFGFIQMSSYQGTQILTPMYHTQQGYITLNLMNNSQIVVPCLSNCQICQNYQCTNCFLGYYLSNNICSQCDPSCASCSGPSICESCPNIGGIVLVDGKCLSKQQIFSQIQNVNLTNSTNQILLSQANLLVSYYDLKQGPQNLCPTQSCIAGVCNYGFCTCQGGSIGYFCEQPFEVIAEINSLTSPIISMISTSDLIIASNILVMLSQLSYSFNSTVANQILGFINYNSTYTKEQNNTLFNNYAKIIINLFEVKYFIDDTMDVTKLINEIHKLQQFAESNYGNITAETRFGTFVYGNLSQIVLQSQIVQQNIDTLAKQNQSYYLQLFSDFNQNTYQYFTNYTSNKISFNNFSQQLNLQKSKSQLYNSTQLICASLSKDKIKPLDKPIIQDTYYQCNPQGYDNLFVCHYLDYLIPPKQEDEIWSANNTGFITCFSVYGIYIALALFFYYNQKQGVKIKKLESKVQANLIINQSKDHTNNQSKNESGKDQLLSPGGPSSRLQAQPFLQFDVQSPKYSVIEQANPQFIQEDQIRQSSEDDDMNDIEEDVNARPIQQKKKNRISSKDLNNMSADSLRKQSADTVVKQPSKTENQENSTDNKNSIFFTQPNFPSTNKYKVQIQLIDDELSQKIKPNDVEIVVDNPMEIPQVEHDEGEEIITNDIWNHHPIICIYRAFQFERTFSNQLWYLTLYLYTLHFQMVISIILFEILISIKGNQSSFDPFIVFSIVSDLFTIPFSYLIGFLSKTFVQKLDFDDLELNISWKVWPLFLTIILILDFIISWRAYTFRNGMPDYWLATVFFCPILDMLVFDPFFILICTVIIEYKCVQEIEIFNLLINKGYLQLEYMHQQ